MGKQEKPEKRKGKKGVVETPGEQPRHRGFDWYRENIEAFLVAVLLAIVIRHFSVEAFEIPTGSMATTLYGMHACLTCPNCATEYAVALSSDSSTGEITVGYRRVLVYRGKCQNPRCALDLHSQGPKGTELRSPGDIIRCGACGTTFRGDLDRYQWTEAKLVDARCPICQHITRGAVVERSNRHGGHKILVTKFEYLLAPPRRWDVIVFEFDQWKNYIKRLIGLPGERVEIWDGDVYIDGKVARKPDDVQEVLWTRISDSDVAENGLNPTPAWDELAPKGSRRSVAAAKCAEWDPKARRWSINALGDVAVLRYQRGFENYYSYNLIQWGPQGFPADVQVGDKRVSFVVKAMPGTHPEGSAPSWVGAEIRDGDFTFQLRVPVGAASAGRLATLRRMVADDDAAPSVDRAEAKDPLSASGEFAIPTGKAVKVQLANADDRVVARLDGKEILALEYVSLPEGSSPSQAPAGPSEMPAAQALLILAANVGVTLESIRVDRDMYYIPKTNMGHWNGIQLEAAQYFAMGDNAPSSSDGRYWGSIPEENLMGKAFVVFWPALPWNFQCKFIR